MKRLAVGLALSAASLRCGESERVAEVPAASDDDDDGRPGLTFTHWTEQTELFIELPALVQDVESPCAAHLTRMSDFTPLDRGAVVVVLRGEHRDERFAVDAPSVPGIFRPVVRPASTGPRRLLVQVELGDTTVTHDLGDVQVFASVAAAVAGASEPAAPGGRIPFLKEQQWSIAFATAVVTPASFRPSLRATGRLRARSDGDVLVTATGTGRIAAIGTAFPRIGDTVARDQSLAALTPRLEASDISSLELAVTDAELEVSFAEQERQRLEALRNEGAVPERRVRDAVHDEAQSRAALAAARRRIGQFRRVQRTGGGRAGSVQVRAPLAGVVVDVLVAPGAFVEDGATLFHVVDVTKLWLEVHVPETDVGELARLRGAWFELAGFDETFELDEDAVRSRTPVIDPVARTMTVILAVDNPDARFAVGAAAYVHLVTDDVREELAVPRSALVDDDGRDVVFVEVEGESFERRIVQLGPRDRELVAVRSGVRAGERVVTEGAWSVKLAASSRSVPAHGHSH